MKMKATKVIALISLLIFNDCSENGAGNFIEESGTIETTDILLSSKTAGTVDKIIFDEGDVIRAGDTLMVVDHESLELQLKQAAANKNAVEAQLKLMIKGAREEEIQQAEDALNQAAINFDLAEKDKNRMLNLFEAQSITKKQLDDVTARFEISKSQLNAAQQNYKKIKNIARKEEVDQVRANLQKAEANIELVQKSIKDSYIISPINGHIVESFAEVGEFLAPNSSVYKISNLSEVEIVIYISEEDLGKVKLGQKADVFNDTFKDKSYEGKVTFISPEAEFTPKSIQTKDERTKLVYAVKITIPNPDYELKSGMPADAKVYFD